jgi:hypothetical protein
MDNSPIAQDHVYPNQVTATDKTPLHGGVSFFWIPLILANPRELCPKFAWIGGQKSIADRTLRRSCTDR